MTAPCGLDCFNCPMYLAKENDKLRAIISRKQGIPLEQVSCDGRRNESGKIAFPGMAEPCNVYKCTEKKGIRFCGSVRIFLVIIFIHTRIKHRPFHTTPRFSTCA